LLRELERNGLGQSFHSMLRRHVNARLRQPNMPGDTRCINNCAAAGLEHCGDFMLHRIQDAPNVDVEGPPILFFGDFIKWPCDFDAGIVERYIETTVGRQDEINHPADVGILGDVCADEGCRAAGLDDFRSDIRAFPFATTGDDDFRACVCKGQRRSFPDAGGAPVTSTILLV
jgi:hypothetical protein